MLLILILIVIAVFIFFDAISNSISSYKNDPTEKKIRPVVKTKPSQPLEEVSDQLLKLLEETNSLELTTNSNESLKKWLPENVYTQINQSENSSFQKNIQHLYTKSYLETEVLNRNINNLIHFTTLDNLKSIINSGLIPRGDLVSTDTPFKFNDALRLDDVINSISLSIEFPNHLLFYKWRRQNLSVNWVVLKISPSIIWEKQCNFFKTNAASNEAKKTIYINKLDEFNSMFEGSRPAALKDRYPTDPQAEILCLERIEPAYIKEIITNDIQIVTNYLNDNCSIPIIEDHYYFEKNRL